MSVEQHPDRLHYVRRPAPEVAGCSDCGLRHATNQDAMSLAVRQGPGLAAVLVVADGVSSTPGAEEASLIAAETATRTVLRARAEDVPPADALRLAFSAAHAAVLAASPAPAASTLIAAVVEGTSIVIGNIGDSRAYWVGDDDSALLLSTDDSLAQARIEFGMTRAEAEQSLQAHALTKWIGRRAEDPTPSLSSLEAPGPGLLILCSDGLWNFASEPSAFAAVVAERNVTDPAALTEALAGWANDQGGHDNITVAAVRFG